MDSKIYEFATKLLVELKKNNSPFKVDFSVDNHLKSEKDSEYEILKTLYFELKNYLKI